MSENTDFQEMQCFNDKLSFLLGEIHGKVATMHRQRIDHPETLSKSIDELHNFIKDRVSNLYYRD